MVSKYKKAQHHGKNEVDSMFNDTHLKQELYPQKPVAVFLDRDGVINADSEFYVKSIDEWQPLPGSIAAIAALSQAGIKVFVATNQSGLARGLFSASALKLIHDTLVARVSVMGGEITEIFYCPHGPESLCACRKPKPGLLLSAAKKYELSLAETWLLGDSYRDLEAAWAAGVNPALVLCGNGAATLKKHPELLEEVPIFHDLASFSQWLIGEH